MIVIDHNSLKKIADAFTLELTTAKSGQKTSLPFIVHEIPKSPLVKEGETFQVLKIGGSILQKSLVENRGGEIVIKSLVEDKLPIFTTKDIFLSIIDKHLDPHVSVLSINFAYPMTPVFEKGKLDGILVAGTKEHAFQGLVGQKICETIELYVHAKYGRSIRATIANDTICLTMAGLTRHKAHELAGGIVGTGLNFAIFLDDTHVVNLEAANFDKFQQSEEGKQIDAQSLTLGRSLFEKEVAGAYLHHHLNILLTKNRINQPPIESTHDLDRLAQGNIFRVSPLAKQLFEHSASLVACQVAGITQFYNCDMTFVMEGSLFWVGWHYQQMVEKFVKQLAPKYKITFEEIKDCGIIGAAKLVT